MLSAEKIRQIDAYYEAKDSWLVKLFGCSWFVPPVESIFPNGQTYAEYHRLKREKVDKELAIIDIQMIPLIQQSISVMENLMEVAEHQYLLRELHNYPAYDVPHPSTHST